MSELLPCPFCGGAATVGANEYYDGANTFYIYCASCGVQQMTTKIRTDEAISAWNRRAKPENKPLTQDELKQMEGEPVWIVTLDGTDEPRWEIVVSAGKCGVDLICVLNGVETRDYADFDLYNDTWLAYRSKPERSKGE